VQKAKGKTAAGKSGDARTRIQPRSALMAHVCRARDTFVHVIKM
jgi:hypothetical protein